jgi:hypothetical protein
MSKRTPFSQLFTQMLFVTALGIAILSTAYPAQAAYTVTPPDTGLSPATSTNQRPKTSLTYAANRFLLTVKNIKSLTYTIEYTRSLPTGGTAMEGLQGGGKAGKNGIYSSRLFAGTQSSKYFIPHNVLSGSIVLKAVDLQGKTYNYRARFVIKKGRLVLN